jgi:predicted nucleic acid-binding protein
MVLVDTSVWIDHLRRGDARLAKLLDAQQVLMHPFVAGELACGNLKNRREILGLLDALPQAVAATHAEVRGFIETHRLMGKGLGFVDTSLLAATALGGDAQLWTRDKRLREASLQLGLAFSWPA